MRAASALWVAASFSASAATTRLMADSLAFSSARTTVTCLLRLATSTWRAVSTASSAATALARASSASALAAASSLDLLATRMFCSWPRMVTAALACTLASSVTRLASMRLVWISRSAAILADSASLRAAASVAAMADCWLAVSVAMSCSVFRRTSSVCLRRDCCRRVASRFLVSMATAVSCSMSLTFLRRASVSRVSTSRPSASKALDGSKNCFCVWFRAVRDTLSSSKPFLAMSSATTCCTCCTNWARWAFRSYMGIFTATARSASTNLASTWALSSGGSMVSRPRVWAALATDSSSAFTRT